MQKPFAPALFLARLKPLIEGRKLLFAPRNRRKTREFMLKEGLHDEDAYDIISCLQSKHFYKGPESDDDGSPGNVMVFIYPYAGKRLYIKLKIWSEVNGYAGAVMSFHEEGKHA